MQVPGSAPPRRAMGNVAIRCFFSRMKEKSKTLKGSLGAWVQMANMVQAWRGLAKPKTAKKPNKVGQPSVFPPEVIMEILSWLPLKTLVLVQLVCKDWQAFITDHYFIEKHMDHSPVVVCHLFNVMRSANKQDHDSITFIQGCDGLLLLKNNTIGKYCLWNPVLHRVLELPDPQEISFGFTILYVPTTRNYRVVSIYKDKDSGRECCEVFTPGHSTSWKCLKFPEIVNVPGSRKYTKSSIVAAGGAVHVVLTIKAGDQTFEKVVSLDMATEHFTVNHLPKSLSTDWSLDWDGKLAFVRIVGDNLEVRQLPDYKKQRWCEEKQVMHLPFLKGIADHEERVLPLFAKQGELWFWLKDVKIFTYTIETGETTGVRHSEAFSLSSRFYPYKPSLISFKGMVEDTRLDHLRPTFRID